MVNHLFKVSRVPKQCSGIFEVSNAWINLWNNMMEEKAGVKKQNSKKGFEKNDHSCSMEGILLVLNPTASQY